MADVPRLTPNDRIKMAVQIMSANIVLDPKTALRLVKKVEEAYDSVYAQENPKTVAEAQPED